MKNEMLNNVATKLGENKGGILTGVTIVGAIATTALTALATWKIKTIIDKNDGVIDKNVVKDCVKVSVLPAGALLITVFSAAGAHKAEVAKYGALAALYASDSKKIEDLTKKLGKKEVITVDKDGNLVKDEILVKDKKLAYGGEDPKILDDTISPKEREKKRKIYDEYLGQFLECSINDIIKALNHTNEMLNDEKNQLTGEIARIYAFDAFYEDLGVEIRGSKNKSIGWTEDDGYITPEFDGAIDDNFQLYYTFKFSTEPHDIDAENPSKWKRY